MTERDDTLINHLVSHRYEVLEKIGESPLFTVYKARDKSMNCMVTLKVVVGAFNRDTPFLEGVQSGVRTAMALDHPNIASFLDLGEYEDSLYLVAEFVRGLDLKERIRRIAPFTLAISIDVACSLTEAVLYAHANGQVHGDLRPHNLIMGADGTVKVTDFGLMTGVFHSPRADADTLTRAASYRAPELFFEQTITPAGDIYAIGAILYEMLTGTPIYTAESLDAFAQLHASSPIPLPRVLNAGVPRSVEGIIAKCLQKRPEARYPSANDLLTDLKAVRDALRFGKPLSWSPIDVERLASDLPGAALPASPSTASPGNMRIVGPTGMEGVAKGASGRTNSAPTNSVPFAAPSEPVAVAAASSQAVPMPSKNHLRENDERIAIGLKIAIGMVASIILGCLLVLAGIYASKWVEPESVVIPKLVGKDIEEVRKLATQKKLHLIEHPEYIEKPRGIVFRTDEDDGAKMYQGHDLNVWYSKGPTYVAVPNVVNLQREEAEQKLTEAGLTVGKVILDYSPKIPANVVMSQNVSYKKRVLHDQPVDLVVSDGPKPDNGTDPGTDGTTGGGTGTVPTGDSGANGSGSNGSGASADADNSDSTTNPNPPSDPGNSESHEFNRSIHIKKDGKGRRRVRIEVVDANGLSNTPVNDEEFDEDARIPLSFTYFGKKIRLRIFYNDKLSWTTTFDPVATQHDIVR